MKNKTYKKYQYKLTFTLGLVIFFILGLLAGLFMEDISKIIYPSNLQPRVSNCTNLSLQATTYCLRNNLSTFYNYNSSNWLKNINTTQLETEGGVCWHWTEWYEKNIKALTSYNTKRIILTNMGNDSHEFLVIYDNKTYCIADQTDIRC